MSRGKRGEEKEEEEEEGEIVAFSWRLKITIVISCPHGEERGTHKQLWATGGARVRRKAIAACAHMTVCGQWSTVLARKKKKKRGGEKKLIYGRAWVRARVRAYERKRKSRGGQKGELVAAAFKRPQHFQ